MERLSKVLKDIYTSGNKYTVLQLLDKMIKEVEKYEADKIIEEGPVYTHFVTLSCNQGTIFLSISTTYDQQLTVDDIKLIMVHNGNSIQCSGSYNPDLNAVYPAIALKISNDTGNLVVRYIDTTEEEVVLDTHDLEVNTIIDSVINIKEVLS